MTDGQAGGMIAARTPDGRAVTINEKLVDSYVARGFTITDEQAAKRIARAHSAAPKAAPITLAPGQIAATDPSGRVVTINAKLKHEYAARGFTFKGSGAPEYEATGVREPEGARVIVDPENEKRTLMVPGEVQMTDPTGRVVNVSAKFAETYLERGYTVVRLPAQAVELADAVLPDPMQPGQGPETAGGGHAGTSY